MENKNEVAIFNNDQFEVKARQNGDQLEFEIDGVAKSLGFSRIRAERQNNKESIRWDRVNEYLQSFGLSPKVGTGDFIPEQYVYLLGMKATNDIAIAFQKWLAFDVLPSIRKHGAYIGENADIDYVNNELRFSTKRTIKTFANAKVSELNDLYSEFKEYMSKEYKFKTDIRISRYKSVEKGLQVLLNTVSLAGADNIGDAYNIRKLKEQVILDRTKIEKKSLGGDKAGKTRQIKSLQDELDNIYPNEWEYITLPVHGFSNNYMFYTVDGNTYKTQAYKNWINRFPTEEVPDIEYWDVDFTKPVELFLNFVAKEEHDLENLVKSFIDQIFGRIYGLDDNIIHCVHSQRVGTVSSYDDGTIGFYIRNVKGV